MSVMKRLNTAWRVDGVPLAKSSVRSDCVGKRKPPLPMMPINSASAAGRSPDAPIAVA